MARRLSAVGVSELSPRETQLLQLASEGLTDQAISNQLAISLATIATYWGRIRIKFGPLSRTEIVAKYVQSQANEELFHLKSQLDGLKNQIASGEENGLSYLYLLYAPLSIMAMTPQGIITFVNQKTLEMTGYGTSDLVGQSIFDFWPSDRHEFWREWSEALLNAPQSQQHTRNQRSYFRLKNGTLAQFVADISVVRHGESEEFIVVSREETMI